MNSTNNYVFNLGNKERGEFEGSINIKEILASL